MRRKKKIQNTKGITRINTSMMREKEKKQKQKQNTKDIKEDMCTTRISTNMKQKKKKKEHKGRKVHREKGHAESQRKRKRRSSELSFAPFTKSSFKEET